MTTCVQPTPARRRSLCPACVLPPQVCIRWESRASLHLRSIKSSHKQLIGCFACRLRQMHAVGLSSLTHNKISHLFLLFFVERKKTVRANSVSFLCILQLCLFSSFPSLPSSYRVFSQFSLFGFIALLSSHFSSPSPLSSPYFPHLLSLPLLSLLPLFRLCKVQLGFGAFGLQAWRQEDALSEYALLGSLCVTLYFFALLFYLYLLLFNFFPPYIRRVTVILSCGFSSLVEEDPLLLISSVLCRNLLNLQKKHAKSVE